MWGVEGEMTQLFLNGLLLHLRLSLLHAFHHSLLRETFLIGALDGLSDVVIVLYGQDGFLRQELEERLHVLHQSGQLRHDVCPFTTFF